jgi:hypothetical protein
MKFVRITIPQNSLFSSIRRREISGWDYLKSRFER